MLKIVFDLTDFEEVELIQIADVHCGNPLCDIQTLHDIISYVNSEPDNPKCARICLLNGDLTESVTRTSVGDPFSMTMTPSVQVATMIQMLKPLAEPHEHYPQGKILSYCGGNHDEQRYKDTGISSSQSIAVGLGVEDRYSPDGCYSFIKLQSVERGTKRNVTATVYNQHLTGGASTIGGKANRLQKMSNIYADLYCGAHFHTPLTFKEDVIVPYTQNCTLSQKTMTFVIGSAFLRYGDYAQRASMKPATISIPKIFIRQERTKDRNQKRFIIIEVLL